MTDPSSLPTSYWHATFPPPAPEDALPTGADVVVIGGGMLGCWTAYWLAKRGVNVTVLEREVLSWGATGRNGGFLTGGAAMGYGAAIETFGRETALSLWKLAEAGRDLAGDVIAEEGIDCDFRTPGRVAIAQTEHALADMSHDLDLLREDGFGGEMLDRQGVQEMVRTPLGADVVGGVYSPGDGLLHSGRYLAGIAAAAKRHGARFCRAEVTAITPENEGSMLTTSAGPLRAARVVVAVNAWSDTLVPALSGVIQPVRGQILAYDPIEQMFETGLFADVTPTGEYWQQTPDGAIVIGGCRGEAPGGDVGVRDMVPTPDVTSAIEAIIPRLFPQLDGLHVARRWAGLMAFTRDYLPIADRAPDMPGIWVGGGFCGHGMPFGPRVGQLLAEAAANDETPAALQPLRIDRDTLGAF